MTEPSTESNPWLDFQNPCVLRDILTWFKPQTNANERKIMSETPRTEYQICGSALPETKVIWYETNTWSVNRGEPDPKWAPENDKKPKSNAACTSRAYANKSHIGKLKNPLDPRDKWYANSRSKPMEQIKHHKMIETKPERIRIKYQTNSRTGNTIESRENVGNGMHQPNLFCALSLGRASYRRDGR
jgi:hypothetical protein